jgi:hypothetical protein
MFEDTPARAATPVNFPLLSPVLLISVVGAAGYAFHEHNVARSSQPIMAPSPQRLMQLVTSSTR